MTDEELAYATNETLDQLEEYRKQILARFRGKILKAYSGKLFQVERAEVAHGSIMLCGSVLRKNGMPHARCEYGVNFDEAEIVSIYEARP